MNNKIVASVLQFFLFAALQVIVFDKLQLNAYINVFIYTAFVLLLPFEISGALLLLLGFVMGLLMDVFSNTGGLHAAACTFMAFCRPGVLRFISPREGYDSSASPTISSMGFGWFVTYALLMVFLHNLVCYFLEVFRFSEFFFTMAKVILTTFVTVLLLIAAQLVTGKPIKS
jgi:rod shape-determining protein MreD